MKISILFLIWVGTLSCSLAALLDVIPDCCRRGSTFASLGRTCEDLETTPDIARPDQEACMAIMMSCCSESLRPVLCAKGMDHRMNIGSCHTLGTDTCFSSAKACCDCCDLGIAAFFDGIPCNSMMTGTSCDSSFQQCCQAAAERHDEDECTGYSDYRLCTERCVNLIGSYVCECYAGNRLLEDNITCVAGGDGIERPPLGRYSPCARAPCQHRCQARGREYECLCNEGFQLMSNGHSCTDIDECARHPGACSYTERCLNTNGSFTCINDVVCRNGLIYERLSEQCVDIDECAENLHNCDEQISVCENRHGSYECVPEQRCPAMYYFDRLTDTCRDVDECSRGTHNCQTGFRCDNLEGSFTCTRIVPCGTGYTINGRTQQCVDVDECSQRSHNCQVTERCINVRGSYRCVSCPRGFRIDNNNRCMQDVDECQDGSYQCNEGTRCQNIRGSYECISVCMQGFDYNRVLRACMDVDECQRGVSNCAIYEICQNLNGSFSCGCRRGFRANSYGQCVDIDECREGASECLPHQQCYNLQGQYQCRNRCRTGFRFNRLNNNCEDIDECAEGEHRCQDNQRCINQEGGYVCQCPAGHQANREQGTCDDIDECRLGLCRGTCQNIPGSYICTCPSGYLLMENKVTCKDVDECTVGTDTCQADEFCFNTRGGFKCEDIVCPQYYQLQARTTMCIRQPCESGNNYCLYQPLSISHKFISLPAGFRKDITIYKIQTKPNPNYDYFYRMPHGNRGREFKLEQDGSKASIKIVRSLVGPLDYDIYFYMEVFLKGTSKFLGEYMTKIYVNVSPHPFPYM